MKVDLKQYDWAQQERQTVEQRLRIRVEARHNPEDFRAVSTEPPAQRREGGSAGTVLETSEPSHASMKRILVSSPLQVGVKAELSFTEWPY